MKPCKSCGVDCVTAPKRSVKCWDCHRSYMRDHYRANKASYLARNARTKQKIRDFVRKAKNVPCADCGVMYPYFVMDFDHKFEKEFILSKAGCIGSLQRVKEEINKCDVVCANCHRIRSNSSLA